MTSDTIARTASTSRLSARRLRGPDRSIVNWLATRLASHLETSPSAIDPTVPLAEMGVDSVHAVGLVGDVEMEFDIDVDATMIFDYPTLSHIAEYISAAVAEQHEVVA